MAPHKQYAIIAGASGLVGDELLHQLLSNNHFHGVYTLSRQPLPFHSNKLTQLIDHELRITDWPEIAPSPVVGFICLGSTLKQAGSKAALEAVDVRLVKEVARTMHTLGVKHLVVISSLLASSWSPSHYLRCKGKMEILISGIGFEHVAFIRPGPLKGERGVPRLDEQITQGIFQILNPFMLGPLHHFTPIPIENVAKSMIDLAIKAQQDTLPPITTLSGHHIFTSQRPKFEFDV